MNFPEETVKLFIREYFNWNERANSLRKSHSFQGRLPEATIVKIRHEYLEIIDRFCTETVKPQPVSYGDDPMHSPDLELIKSIENDGKKAVVKTEYTEATFNFKSDYEYYLCHCDNQWKIESILYVDRENKYECL